MKPGFEQFDDDLTPEELEATAAEALPERAAMSTLNLTSLDVAGGTVEAVGDHPGGAADEAAAGQPPAAEPAPTDTGADPAPPAAAESGTGHMPPGQYKKLYNVDLWQKGPYSGPPTVSVPATFGDAECFPLPLAELNGNPGASSHP